MTEPEEPIRVEVRIFLDVYDVECLKRLAFERREQVWHDTAEWEPKDLGELFLEAYCFSNPDPLGPMDMGFELHSWDFWQERPYEITRPEESAEEVAVVED